ncbi:hypothetical protein, partial [Burkholderia ubonensis]|uniref:hypothetical protein n=1 Tax=Burkholderia ubonensis TaxID=101571 RepID=UPI001E5A78F6
ITSTQFRLIIEQHNSMESYFWDETLGRPFMSACASESVLRIRQVIGRRKKLSATQRRCGLQVLKPVRIALLFSVSDSSTVRAPSPVDNFLSHSGPSMALGALPFVMRGDTDIRIRQTATAALRRRIMKTFQAVGMKKPVRQLVFGTSRTAVAV